MLIPTFKLPPFTFAFNVIMYFTLFAVFKFEYFHFAQPFGSAALPVESEADFEISASIVFIGWLKGVSQIYILENWIS